MKLTRLLILAAAVLALSGVAMANTIDPAIGVKGTGGGGSTQWGDGTGAGSLNIFFDPSTAGVTCVGNVCDYVTPSSNPFFITSGSITDFQYSFDQSQNTAFSLAADSVFPIVTVQPGHDVGSSNPIAFLSGGTITPAPILTLALFSPLISATPGISGDFLLIARGVVLGTTGTVTSNVPLPVPEPASIALMLSGLGALGLRRLRRAKKAAGANLAA